MDCRELISNRSADRVDLGRFQLLHPEGQGLISRWFERAWQARERPAEDSFGSMSSLRFIIPAGMDGLFELV